MLGYCFVDMTGMAVQVVAFQSDSPPFVGLLAQAILVYAFAADQLVFGDHLRGI